MRKEQVKKGKGHTCQLYFNGDSWKLPDNNFDIGENLVTKPHFAVREARLYSFYSWVPRKILLPKKILLLWKKKKMTIRRKLASLLADGGRMGGEERLIKIPMFSCWILKTFITVFL